MKKIKKYLLPVLFMGAITLLAAFTFFGPYKTYSENEKRVLNEFPVLSVDTVLSGEFQDSLEAYISDHIKGRDFFVGVNAYFDKLIGKNALNDIYSADGGYLINAPKDISEASFVKNMENFEKFSAQSGIDSTLMIIPTAGYIMEDRLPTFHKPYRDEELFVLASSLTESIRFLDTRGYLFDRYSEGEEVYYHTDHHLTSEGSYTLYKEYCSLLGMSTPDREDYTVKKAEGFRGTTYSGSGYFMEEPDTLEIWDLGLDTEVTFEDGKRSDTMFFEEHLEKLDMYPVYLDGNHSYVRIHNPDAKGGNLLMIRDSYGQNMAPFMAYNYKNIYMLDMRYYRGSMQKFLEENQIDEILYLYGIDTLLTDESTTWLFF